MLLGMTALGIAFTVILGVAGLAAAIFFSRLFFKNYLGSVAVDEDESLHRACQEPAFEVEYPPKTNKFLSDGNTEPHEGNNVTGNTHYRDVYGDEEFQQEAQKKCEEIHKNLPHHQEGEIVLMNRAHYAEDSSENKDLDKIESFDSPFQGNVREKEDSSSA